MILTYSFKLYVSIICSDVYSKRTPNHLHKFTPTRIHTHTL